MQPLTFFDKLLVALATFSVILLVASVSYGYRAANEEELSKANSCVKKKLLSIDSPSKMNVLTFTRECKEEAKKEKKAKAREKAREESKQS